MPPRLLIKIASKSRPKALAEVIETCTNLATQESDKVSLGFLITADNDDPSMRDFDPKQHTDRPATIVFGKSPNKIMAMNRDLGPQDFEVVALFSDDVVPVTPGYDEVIMDEFAAHFPDYDGCIWASDGLNERTCCHPIVGRKYLSAIGTIYDERYKAFYADDSFTLKAKRAGKMKKVDSFKLLHKHMNNKHRKIDALDRLNRRHMVEDMKTFLTWRRNGFK